MAWRECGPPPPARILKYPVRYLRGSSIPGVGNVAIPIDGARARGGPVEAGGAYVVGEGGPEIFRPRSSGTIIPNSAAAARSADPAPAAAPRVNMRTVIQVSGAGDPEAVARRVLAIIDRKYRDGLGGIFADVGLDTA